MSKADILYVKGMTMSETEEDEMHEDIWDDKKLNDAYDRALRIASTEVAKRVAMSTNTQHINKEDYSKSNKVKSPKSSSSKKKHNWKVGSPCRAVYEGDGLEYEAFILRIINDKECVVRFLGYDNSEIVSISSLKQSLGNEERSRQIEQSLGEKEDDGFASHSANETMDCSTDRAPTPMTAERSTNKKKKSSKKNSHTKMLNSLEMPDMPFSMPNPSFVKNIGCMEMPFPPPPTLNFSNKTDTEEQAISSMLLSWYMSGYYTGLYQGIKRAKGRGRTE